MKGQHPTLIAVDEKRRLHHAQVHAYTRRLAASVLAGVVQLVHAQIVELAVECSAAVLPLRIADSCQPRETIAVDPCGLQWASK